MKSWAKKLNPIRAILFEEEPGAWSAQCLEYDIGAQAETFLDLQDELLRALVTHIAASVQVGREPFLGIKEAPRRYWKVFESGLRVEGRPTPVSCEGVKLPRINLELRVARSSAIVPAAA
jgi:hypothetical protein